MQTVTYERVSPKDFQPGDVVHHWTWVMTGVKRATPYRIIDNVDGRIRCTLGNYTAINNFTREAFGEDAYENDWWVREVHELKYDPNQQGDTDEDI